MSFTQPIVLLLLIVPALLVAWVWRRKDRRISLPFDHGQPRSGLGWRIAIDIFETLPALVMAIAIILLAGPQQLSEPKSERVMTNIELCVDISGSMTAPFGDGSRYDASMSSIDEFLNFRRGDAFGLTFFGNSVLHWVPLTSDVSAIRCAAPFMRPENAPSGFGGTEIAKALNACKSLLMERTEGDRMIILITDGFSFDLSNGNDEVVGKSLRDNGITLYSILVGGMEAPDEVTNVTEITGGETFEAGDPEGLTAVFARIDKMQKTRMKRSLAETMDNFVPFAVVGLSLLGFCSLALFGMRYTPW